MGISEKKMKIVIDNYFHSECNVNTSIHSAFEKGFRIGVEKGLSAQPEPCEDAVSRKDVVKFLDDWTSALNANCHHQSMADLKIIKNDFENLPSAQPEPEIIACGDCKHYICHDRRCGYWNHGVKPLEWCCHGEERNG